MEASAIGHRSDPKRIDRSMHSKLSMPSSVEAETFVDFSMPGWGPFHLFPRMIKGSVYVTLEDGELELYNFALPHVYHSIKVKPRGRKSRVEKWYTFSGGLGEEWWTTYVFPQNIIVFFQSSVMFRTFIRYRYQLEAFMDKIKGRDPQTWPPEDEAVKQLKWVENIYRKVRNWF